MNQEEINDLLELTAMAEIDPQDMQSEFASASPEMAIEELRSLHNTAAAIAYAEKPLAILPNLKQRLFNLIQQETVALDFMAVRSTELRWEPHVVNGLMMAVLKINHDQKEVSALIRAEVDVSYPFHRHATGEEIFMLQGKLIDRGVTYKTGDYLYSAAGSIHAPTAIAGCMFFVRTSLDDAFL